MAERTIKRSELRTGLRKILAAAESGTEFTITVRGRPVARLGPTDSPPKAKSKDKAKAEAKPKGKAKAKAEAETRADAAPASASAWEILPAPPVEDAAPAPVADAGDLGEREQPLEDPAD
ncbi:MAG: type II toxin-antitoxin system prevent-host-death family antitoxin [Solirubrobacteraceae bacterium]|jgi:prevent-host-death family protein